MDMDDDPDPEMPPSGTPTHPIEISDGSSFHGSPYRGPDSYEARFASYPWEFTPPFPPQFQQQDPSEDSRFQAVTPPPPPPPEQQPPPESPKRRRSNARMSVRGGFRFSTPQPPSGSHYPPLYEDPQMGGPSNPVSEVDSAPVAPPSPPHMGFDNPIPSYAGAAAYNSFEQPGRFGYNYYNAPDVDPYLVAANYNALHPEGPYGVPYQTGYPAYGYQYPPPPQPLQQQQLQPPQIQPPQQHEILQRSIQVEREVQEERRSHRGFLKGLTSLIKGKNRRDH
ncbi:proline-rich receptor-like protein kinase PERK14 [Helianthus annuus]|uniref:proline-rich receptor-like protein kinase PERK14 n=1 Tax=Helianthus annuus TaxID=4232 RepID=UPI000B901E15|nr:proline-rich receptor-like protein kinase PERK14 [Helianthus annuus]